MDRCRVCGLEVTKMNGRYIHLSKGVYQPTGHPAISSRIEELPTPAKRIAERGPINGR